MEIDKKNNESYGDYLSKKLPHPDEERARDVIEASSKTKLPSLEIEGGKVVFKFKKKGTDVLFLDGIGSKLYTGEYSREFWKRNRSMLSFVNKLKEIYKVKQQINIDSLNRDIEDLNDEWKVRKKESLQDIKKTYIKYNFNELTNTVGKWLHYEPNDLKIILAAALDRRIPGEPIWLFIIAPPSNTKSEFLRSLEDGSFYYHLTSMSSNSLISGYIKPDGEKVRDLAVDLDGKVLVIKDFTVVLTMSKDKRDEILSQLRDAYDGFISKKLGTIDEKIKIETSFGLLAGVTPVIDKFYSVLAQLGERFLKNRMNYPDAIILDSAEENEGKEKEMREELTRAFMGFLTNLEIKEVVFSKEDIVTLKRLATWVAVIRTPVYSNWEGDELVIDIAPQHEKPARLYKQFKKLAKLLAIVEGSNKLTKGVWDCLIKVAKDTSPPDRLAVLEQLEALGIINPLVDEKTLTSKIDLPRTSLRRILYSMSRLQILSLTKKVVKEVEENQWSVNDSFKLTPLYPSYINGQGDSNDDDQETAEGSEGS